MPAPICMNCLTSLGVPSGMGVYLLGPHLSLYVCGGGFVHSLRRTHVHCGRGNYLQGGLTRSLTDFADILVGRIRGGLGHTNIMASMFLAGISGSATADAAAIGSLLIPAMADRGYSRAYSTAVTISGGDYRTYHSLQSDFRDLCLAVGRTSIGGLFMAGIVPGILVPVLRLMFVNYRISKKRKYEKGPSPTPGNRYWTITSEFIYRHWSCPSSSLAASSLASTLPRNLLRLLQPTP